MSHVLAELGMYAIVETPCTYLFVCDRVAHQRQIHQLLEAAQRVQIHQLRQPVLRKDQRSQVRDAGR